MPGNLWPSRMGLSSRKLSALDQYSSELANFDEGGVFTLQEKLIIGGAGMVLGSASEIRGGITTKPKYGVADPKIELVNQYPTYSATRTLKKSISWANCDGAGVQPTYFRSNGAIYQTGLGASAGLNILMLVDGRHMHDGATLKTITFSYRYNGSKPTAIPGAIEQVGVARFARSNDALTTLHTVGTSGGINYSGAFAWRDSLTVETYYNGGNVISLVYTPNQNNVIDKSTYYYALGLVTYIETEAYGITFEFDVSDQRHE